MITPMQNFGNGQEAQERQTAALEDSPALQEPGCAGKTWKRLIGDL